MKPLDYEQRDPQLEMCMAWRREGIGIGIRLSVAVVGVLAVVLGLGYWWLG